MKKLIAAVLSSLALATQVAATTITGITPEEGFTFTPTHVTITGTGFTDGVVQVFFGNTKGFVSEATPTTLRVLAIPPDDPLMRPKLVDVIVKVNGQEDAILSNAFYFSPEAQAGRGDYAMMLVPLTANRVPGANGSLWSAELSVFNGSENLLRMPGPESFIIELPIDPAVIVPSRLTQQVYLSTHFRTEDGAFLYVPRVLIASTKFSLRVRDISQNASSLGTEVPVVLDQNGTSRAFLTDIPTDPRYRSMLRIYGFSGGGQRVGVSIYREGVDELIDEYDVVLKGLVFEDYDPNFPPYPAYIAFDPLTPAVRASGERVRIEIRNYGENVSPPPPPFWAFVSLTHNETQQVTLVTPK